MTKLVRNYKRYVVPFCEAMHYTVGMYEKKHSLTFVVFMSVCAVLIFVSVVGNWDGGAFKDPKGQNIIKATHDSNFRGAHYYVTNEKGPFMDLKAKELMFNNTAGRSFAQSPKGLLYTKDGKIVNYRGRRGVFNDQEQKLTLDYDVHVETGETKASSDKMIYYMDKDIIELAGTVKSSTYYVEQKDYIEIEGDRARIYPESERSEFRDNVKGLVRRARLYEESLYFASDELDIAMTTGKVDLKGNVFMRKQLLRATSRRGEIFLENYNKKLKYFVLYDDVKVVEKIVIDGKTTKRLAYAEKLEGMMSESKAILTGYPKVYQENDVIKGNQIILRENTEVIEVIDANTNILIKD
jgi:lipopolysaccharide export system protein LptA